MTSSCSFRITRTAEDLAQTINALSHRLVKLEQRQEVLELQWKKSQNEPPMEEMQILDGVENLLKECQDLLAMTHSSEEPVLDLSKDEDTLAA